MNRIINYIKKYWKDKQKTDKILSEIVKNAERENPKKTLLTNIIFGLVMISFFILCGFVAKENGKMFIFGNYQPKLFQVFIFLATIFSSGFFYLSYMTIIKKLAGKDMKFNK